MKLHPAETKPFVNNGKASPKAGIRTYEGDLSFSFHPHITSSCAAVITRFGATDEELARTTPSPSLPEGRRRLPDDAVVEGR